MSSEKWNKKTNKSGTRKRSSAEQVKMLGGIASLLQNTIPRYGALSMRRLICT